MLKVIVKRSEWFRGQGPASSYLLRDDGKKCCLGFACLATTAVGPQDILGIRTPAGLDDLGVAEELPHLVNDRQLNTEICERLMTANDDIDITEAEREQLIKKLGDLAEIAFEFEE